MISKASLASLPKLLMALVMVFGAVSLLLSRSSDDPPVQDGERSGQDGERPGQDGGRLPVQVQQLSAHVQATYYFAVRTPVCPHPTKSRN